MSTLGRREWLLGTFGAAACAPRQRSGTPEINAPTRTGGRSYPSVTLSDGPLDALVYLPEAQHGYYQGVRFDHSGIIGSLRVGDISFVAPWQTDPHDPKLHDAVTGPAEEFGFTSPLGFNSAQPGDTFLKIGVGELRRPNRRSYAFNGEYELVRALPFDVAASRSSVRFTQSASPVRGYAYRYVKVLEVNGAEGALTIHHELENTGSLPLVTDHYAHNFFPIQNLPVGPGHSMRFSSPFRGNLQAQGLAQLSPTALAVSRYLKPKESLWVELEPVEPPAVPFDMVLTNQKVPAELRITLSSVPSRLVLWGVREVLCGEPFVVIELEPGQRKTWSARYQFSPRR